MCIHEIEIQVNYVPLLCISSDRSDAMSCIIPYSRRNAVLSVILVFIVLPVIVVIPVFTVFSSVASDCSETSI